MVEAVIGVILVSKLLARSIYPPLASWTRKWINKSHKLSVPGMESTMPKTQCQGHRVDTPRETLPYAKDERLPRETRGVHLGRGIAVG